jgi:hypothetical protein
MHLGRERPPKIGRGTVIGGWQRGSLTPQMPPSLLPTAAPAASRAAKSAAQLTAVKSLIANNIATSPGDTITLLCGELNTEPRTSEGDHCSRVCGPPHPFFAFVHSGSRQGSENSRREIRLERVPTSPRCSTLAHCRWTFTLP